MTVLRSLGRGVVLGAPWLLLLACPFLLMVWVFGLTSHGLPPFLAGVMATGLVSVGAYGLAMLLLALAGLVAWLVDGRRWLRVSRLAIWAMAVFLLVQAACFVTVLFLF